ncbi:probable E3 ubiquitin-protein ligase HECTD2 [Rhopilema esculentum]|uniref:probable E3 ubiquitin-protein ligase HECTD2 n=1 Tax=Rhopilema esculentum TaxID=499914 RepID=UPI0031D15240
MNAAKPPIYRPKTKGSGGYDAKVVGEKKTISSLRRNLSIPDVNIPDNRHELCIPGVLERSTSLTSLSNIRDARLSIKSLSASNLLALSDPNLSIQEAKPKRFYDSPTNNWAKQKAEYTAHAQKYFYQLTKGCRKENCYNKFCKSSNENVMIKFNYNENVAIVLSIELAKTGHKYLCSNCKQKGKIFPKKLLEQTNRENIPFLCLLSTTSPFKSLYYECPMVSSEVCGDIKLFNRSLSHGTLKHDSHSSQSYREKLSLGVSNMARTLSSSISSLWSNHRTPSLTPLASRSDQADGLNLKEKSLAASSSSCTKIFGSDNYVSDEFDDLKEFEMSVASEMNRTSIKPEANEFSLTHLTLEMVDHVLEDFLECGDESFLLSTLRTVFSSYESLSVSFLINETFSSYGHMREVNRNDVKLAYEKILLHDNGTFFKTILDSVRILCSEMLDDCQKIESANHFIIILDLPMLFETDLPYVLVDIFKALPMSARRKLVEGLSKYDPSSFQRILKGFKSLLSSLMMEKVVSDANILSLCNVMKILNEANYWMNSEKLIVPGAEFYSEELSNSLDIKREYQHWQNLIHPEIGRSGMARSTSWSNLEVSGSILEYPFLLKPETKVHLIHYEAINEMRKEYQAAILHQAKVQTVERALNGMSDNSAYSKDVWRAMCPYLVLEVRREFLVEDALEQLQKKVNDLKKPLKIKYIGGGEQGLDMGGLQKEFFQLCVQKLFDPAYGMFLKCGETRNVWFNPQSFEPSANFELTGMILGLAIYNGIILDVPLPGALYAKLKKQKTTLKDLWGIEPTIARSLTELLQYDGNVEEDLCLDFQITESYLASTQPIDLLPGGKDIPVTRKNRNLYVELYVNYLLDERIGKQFDSFAAGFAKVCNGDAIQLFRSDELELLICGSPEIDFSQLEEVTTYIDGFTEDHSLIRHFWHVVNNFTQEQKKRLLSFVTGSDRVPLAGLTSISFIIQRNGPDTDNLPTSMTCFNRLLLPEYKESKLKGKLLIAIENGKGFGLT